MRRALILAYYFPPSVDAGAKRALGFFRHLPAHGWEPTVLTVRDGNYATVADNPWADPGDGSVVRVEEGRYPWQSGAPAGRAEAAGATTDSGLVRRVVREALYVPDAWRGFHRPALAAALRLHAERPFDAVWTTSSPWTSLRPGAALRRGGLPWVADLRDLCLDNQFGYTHDGLRRALDERLERRWLGRADGVTVVTEGQRATLLARRLAERVSVLPNGFLRTPDDLRADAATERPRGATFRIVFTGKIYAGRGHSAAPFLDALVRLRADAPGAFSRLRADFFGRVDAAFAEQVAARDLDDVVTFHGLVSPERAAAVQRAADALLAIVPDGRPDVVLTKTFDYVGALAPTLVIGPTAGAAAEVVRGAGAGGAFEPSDTDGIAGWLRATIESGPESVASRESRLPRVLRWSYAALAGELASVLDAVAR